MMKPMSVTYTHDDNNDDSLMMHIELQPTFSGGESSSSSSRHAPQATGISPTSSSSSSDLEVNDKNRATSDNEEEEDQVYGCQYFFGWLVSSWRKRIALLFGILPVIFFGFEMIPDRCHVCQQDQIDFYFFLAALCGGFGAFLFGHDDGDDDVKKHLQQAPHADNDEECCGSCGCHWDALYDEYCMPRFVGGMISATGSLFSFWIVLSNIPDHWSGILFALFVACLAAMPGIGAYFVLKICFDECCFRQNPYHALMFVDDDDDDVVRRDLWTPFVTPPPPSTTTTTKKNTSPLQNSIVINAKRQ